MGRLWDCVKGTIPQDATRIVEQSIRALECLPELEGWVPPQHSLPNLWWSLVVWGFPFTRFGDTSIIKEHCARIGKSIASTGAPDQKSFSELGAAALLSDLGATSCERLRERDDPTPDWMITLGNERVELEVTQPEQKLAHVKRQQQAVAIAHSLRALEKPWDIIAFVADLLGDGELREFVEAGYSAAPGVIPIEREGMWHIRSEFPSRGPGVIAVGGASDRPPGWWPEEMVNVAPFVYSGTIAGSGATAPPPQVRLRFGVPVTAYLNSAQNKEEKFQGSGNRPFILAIDVGNLPGAWDIFAKKLPSWFEVWTRFSGVLLFTGPRLLAIDKIGWKWRLFANPCPIYPLPRAMPNRVFVSEIMESSMPILSG